jgi:hypothetical protein
MLRSASVSATEKRPKALGQETSSSRTSGDRDTLLAESHLETYGGEVDRALARPDPDQRLQVVGKVEGVLAVVPLLGQPA